MVKKITAQKNGPFLFEGITRIERPDGSFVEIEDKEHICRCGESFNKPFCDGNHIIFEFSSQKSVDRVIPRVDTYEGNGITVFDNRGVCSHRGICYDELPSVFKMLGKGEAFIDPKAASIEKIIEICKRCPSGALSYSLGEGERDLSCEEGDWFVRFAPRRYGYDGPIEVRGGVQLLFEEEAGASQEAPESPYHYALCRCGKSKNMPFCSGEHWRVKFLDESGT